MVNSEGPVRVNQAPSMTMRLQQGHKAKVRSTGNSDMFLRMESVRSQKQSEVEK